MTPPCRTDVPPTFAPSESAWRFTAEERFWLSCSETSESKDQTRRTSGSPLGSMGSRLLSNRLAVSYKSSKALREGLAENNAVKSLRGKRYACWVRRSVYRSCVIT